MSQNKINRKIFSIWLSEDKNLPPLIEKCIESQKKFCAENNFEYELITLENCYKGSKYIQECLNSPHRAGIKYCKASDYLRFYYLNEGYGCYVDADVEIPPYSAGFERFLNEQFVVGEEGCETIPGTIVLGTAVLCSIGSHPLLQKLLHVIETEFRGDNDDNYASSMNLLNIHGVDYQDKMTICEPSVFYPYRHRDNSWNITENTSTIHWFNKSWVDSLPTISIVIPHIPNVGRDNGLLKCMESIEKLDYPQELIDVHIVEIEGTVPEKVKYGVEQSKGEYVCFLANDTEVYPDTLKKAVEVSRRLNKGLVSFNEGHLLEDHGNICAHFICKRELIEKLDNKELFSLAFHHIGVDNFLWAQCLKLNEAHWCEECRIIHNHFSKTGVMDYTYELGWKNLEKDRETLRIKMESLN